MSHPPESGTKETTVINGGLFVFYASCAAVSIGAAIGASGWFVYGSVFWTGFGLLWILAGTVGCLLGLRAAREVDRKASPPGAD